MPRVNFLNLPAGCTPSYNLPIKKQLFYSVVLRTKVVPVGWHNLDVEHHSRLFKEVRNAKEAD